MESIWFAILASVLASVVWVVAIYKIDIHEKEPISLLFKLFVTSIVLSFVAGALNSFDERYFGSFLSFVFVGFVEEGVKFLAVWLIVFKNKEFNSPIDGIIYASISALGFAFVENIQYNYHIIRVLDHDKVDYALFIRASLPFMHVLFSSVWGYALGMYRFYIFSKKRLLMFFILSALIHSIYDITVMIFPFAITFAFAILIAIFIFRVFQLNRISKIDVKYYINCPSCIRKVPENSLFCKFCGNKIKLKPFEVVDVYCRFCLQQVKSDSEFCSSCGKEL